MSSFRLRTLVCASLLLLPLLAGCDLISDTPTNPSVQLPPPEAPALQFTLPDEGLTITEPTTLTVTGEGLARVDFLLDGALDSRDEVAPFEWTLDPRLLANGAHEITVEATRADGSGQIATVTINIDNPAPPEPGALAFVLPDDGATLTEPFDVSVTGDDLVRVRFELDGVTVLDDQTDPFVWQLAPAPLTNGTHDLTVRATRAGGAEELVSIQFRVDNPELPPADATVTVDATQRFQTMDGWGISLPAAATPQYGINMLCSFPFRPGDDDVFYDLLFDKDQGIGLTHVTVYQHWDIEGFWSGTSTWHYEVTNDNNDPDVINWAGMGLDEDWPNFKVMKKAAPYGVKFKLQVGSIPAWMKSGAKLRSDMRAEHAEFMAAMLLFARDTVGVEFDYVTLQNEPDTPPERYNPTEMALAAQVLVDRMDKEGLDTKIVGPECVSVNNGIYYGKELLAIPSVADRLAAIAVHPYGANEVNYWNQLKQYGDDNNVPIWQGEWSTAPTTTGVTFDMPDAMRLAKDMLYHIEEGNVACWYFFLGVGSTTGQDGGREGAIIIFTPTGGSNFSYLLPPRYHAFGQFSKHVRPGDVRVGASASNSAIQTVAFEGEDGSVSVVMINTGSSTITTAVSGFGSAAKVTGTRTAQGADGASVGALTLVNGATVVSLPPQSITTVTSR